MPGAYIILENAYEHVEPPITIERESFHEYDVFYYIDYVQDYMCFLFLISNELSTCDPDTISISYSIYVGMDEPDYGRFAVFRFRREILGNQLVYFNWEARVKTLEQNDFKVLDESGMKKPSFLINWQQLLLLYCFDQVGLDECYF